MSLLGTSWDDPRTAGVFGIASQLMGAQNVGQGLMAGMGDYLRTMQLAKQQQAQDEMRKLQMSNERLRLESAQRAAARQQAMEDLPGQFLKAGVRPDTMDDRDVGQRGEPAVPPQQFDMGGYANAMFRYDPRTAIELQQSLRKDVTPIKLGSGEVLYDPKTLRPIASNPKADDMPSAVREYQFAVGQGYKGSFEQWDTARKRAGAASTTVTLGSPVPVTLPDGTPALVQPANRPGEPPQILRLPNSPEPLRPPPKELPASTKEKLAENAVALDRISKAIELVDTNGRSLGFQNVVGDALMQRLDPKGVEVRAYVADIGSQKIHDRSGAAVTLSEAPRLKPFVPDATDRPETVKIKLARLQQEYQKIQQELQSGATIRQATGSSATPKPAGQSGGWSITPVSP
ncbi:MAG: hypothetical protein RLZZ182_2170 [Pseudomonadota bacterium]